MKEDVVPCDRDVEFEKKLEDLKQAIRTRAHTLVDSGSSPEDFYNSGILRSAIESLRGTNSAEMAEKREFVATVLNDLLKRKKISNWKASGSKNRFDYSIELSNGKVAVIELKGCLDGNNTNIFERPLHADEFIIWSVCQNPAADPRKNIWSGLHTRLSADIVSREKKVDGLIVWDMLCGKFRKCPKLATPGRNVEIEKYNLPPPCIYVFPSSVPSPRNNPKPRSGRLEDNEFLNLLASEYKVLADEINFVSFEVAYSESDITRTTEVVRNSRSVKKSKPTTIKRQ